MGTSPGHRHGAVPAAEPRPCGGTGLSSPHHGGQQEGCGAAGARPEPCRAKPSRAGLGRARQEAPVGEGAAGTAGDASAPEKKAKARLVPIHQEVWGLWEGRLAKGLVSCLDSDQEHLFLGTASLPLPNRPGTVRAAERQRPNKEVVALKAEQKSLRIHASCDLLKCRIFHPVWSLWSAHVIYISKINATARIHSKIIFPFRK